MKQLKNKILMIMVLTLISINLNAGWAKYRDKIFRPSKKEKKSKDKKLIDKINEKYEQKQETKKTQPQNISVSDDFQMEVVRLVNIERKKRGLKPLTISNKLFSAANVRANELTRKFSHTRPDGSEYITAVESSGYDWSFVAENIAAGQINPSDVMKSWMNSDGHRRNILNPNYKEIGVGFVNYKGTIYWVQLFGSSK